MAISCVQKSPDYVPGEYPDGAQVFFPNNVSTGTITLDETKPIIIPVNRVNTTNALSVNIVSNAFSGFNIPSSIEFAAGAKSADLVITYDIDKFQRDEYYDINLSLENDITPYGINKYNFTVYLNPWVSLGMGQWFDQLALSTESSLGIQPVEVLHNGVKPELYRIMLPYANKEQLAASWSQEQLGKDVSEYIEFTVLSTGNVTWDKFWYPGLIYTPGDYSSNIKAYLPSARKASDAPYDAYSGFDSDNDKIIWFYPYYYIDGLGGFGVKPCCLSLPGGPDLNDFLQ